MSGELELIQGEGGVRPADPDFLQELERLCRDRDAGWGCGRRRAFGWSGWQAAGLVVPCRVQDQFPDEFAAVAVDDTDV